MIPLLAIREKAMQLLAADATTLAPVANGNKVALVMDAFTPSETLTIGELTMATFTGATPLTAGVGAQPEGLDPNTNDAIITIPPPAGGWRWETTDAVNLPQTIHGYCLLDNALAVLFAAELLSSPITLNGANQVIQLPAVTLTQKAGSIV